MRRIPPIALTVALVVLAGCGEGNDGPKKVASQVPSKPPYALSIDRADLVSGKTYTTRRFEPALRFTVGKGNWIVENRESPTDFAISAELDGFSASELSWHRVTRVFDPEKGGVLPRDLVPLSSDFATWLTRHPRLRTTQPKDVTVAGVDGVQIDVTSKSQPPRVPRGCGKAGPRCVPVFYDGQDTLTYTQGDKGRFFVLQVPGGEELVLEEFAGPGDAKHFAKMLDAFRPTLESLALAG